jgi:drug/metabolite transporter (DMT)-like permease
MKVLGRLCRVQTTRLSAWLPYWWVLAVVWGSSFFLIKIGLESFVPLQITFGRVLFGFLAVIVVVLAGRHRLPRWGPVWGHVAFVGLMTNVIPFTLFAWAVQRRDAVVHGPVRTGHRAR